MSGSATSRPHPAAGTAPAVGHAGVHPGVTALMGRRGRHLRDRLVAPPDVTYHATILVALAVTAVLLLRSPRRGA